jgi:hypothetical protein
VNAMEMGPPRRRQACPAATPAASTGAGPTWMRTAPACNRACSVVGALPTTSAGATIAGPRPAASEIQPRTASSTTGPSVSPRTTQASPSAVAINCAFCRDCPASSKEKSAARSPYLLAAVRVSSTGSTSAAAKRRMRGSASRRHACFALPGSRRRTHPHLCRSTPRRGPARRPCRHGQPSLRAAPARTSGPHACCRPSRWCDASAGSPACRRRSPLGRPTGWQQVGAGDARIGERAWLRRAAAGR